MLLIIKIYLLIGCLYALLSIYILTKMYGMDLHEKEVALGVTMATLFNIFLYPLSFIIGIRAGIEEEKRNKLSDIIINNIDETEESK